MRSLPVVTAWRPRVMPHRAEIYRDWAAGGWNSLTGPSIHGGQDLPFLLLAACTELWNAAFMAFAQCPLLTTGAIAPIAAHRSDPIKQHYLPKMISGECSGTTTLTEPQSGSDLSQVRCKAQRNTDGIYRISGSKIYLTSGAHGLCRKNRPGLNPPRCLHSADLRGHERDPGHRPCDPKTGPEGRPDPRGNFANGPDRGCCTSRKLGADQLCHIAQHAAQRPDCRFRIPGRLH